jgi:two-component system sensor histidine kinase KdpD
MLRGDFDKGQASLLYLPVVVVCAVRLGFGPAIGAAVFSFVAWNFFFLPPYFTLLVHDYRDWLSLVIFLAAAVTTAKLASDAREQAEQARRRETEIRTLYEASQEASQEVDARRLFPLLAGQVEQLCRSPRCLMFAVADGGPGLELLVEPPADSSLTLAAITTVAEESVKKGQEFGLGPTDLWAKAIIESQLIRREDMGMVRGAYVPMLVLGRRMGVVYVAPRNDGKAFTDLDERIIRTLANHAAVALARRQLSEQAAQADALREADALKDRILSLASHEMRTPLAAIKAAATGLLQADAEYADADRRDALGSIAKEVDRLANLVANMLDLSRLEAGSWKPQRDWCDVAEVVGTALDRLDESASARVEVRAADGLPLVRADYTQLALALTNLLTNAVKYGPEDGVIVVDVAKHGDRIEIAVRDFGEGIQRGDEARVFERFYRSPRHRASTIHGTGLGLSLVQAIVTAHGGDIIARNAEPGAVFTVSLPVD